MRRVFGLATALVVALAASAAAQDYVKTNATGLLEARPGSATQVAFADGSGPSPLQTVTLPTSGGTPPFTLSVASGSLPAGLAFAPNTLHATGTTGAAGFTTLGLSGVDVTGDASSFVIRAVVAVAADGKNVGADLEGGASACGWWFDAVAGSTVSINVATTKGREKRTLEPTLLGPDRGELDVAFKTKLGGFSATKVVCPTSGRYYVIASGPNGGATRLLATLATKPPKSGKGAILAFDPDATTTFSVGALPGATLVLKFAGDKKLGLVAKALTATNPAGATVPLASFVKATATGGTLTMPLPLGGTWTFRLGATSATGGFGKLTWSYAVKQPKGVRFSAD
jgi:hypothetical protein